jgi:hypothetical protein
MRGTSDERRDGEEGAKTRLTTTLFEILWAISEVTEDQNEVLAVFAELTRESRLRLPDASGLIQSTVAAAA